LNLLHHGVWSDDCKSRSGGSEEMESASDDSEPVKVVVDERKLVPNLP
jgi:hypothetical protein